MVNAPSATMRAAQALLVQLREELGGDVNVRAALEGWVSVTRVLRRTRGMGPGAVKLALELIAAPPASPAVPPPAADRPFPCTSPIWCDGGDSDCWGCPYAE